MFRKCLWAVILIGFLALPSFASAGQWEGSIQGLMCVTQGRVCPVDMEDPLIATESTFVLLTKDGTWYLLPNMDRGVLARHVNQRVQIEGEKSQKYNSISVTAFKVERKGEWKTVWSPAMEWKFRDKYQIGPKSR